MHAIIKILSSFFLTKRQRAEARVSLANYFYGRQSRRVAHIGRGVSFGGPVQLTRQTTVGDGCAFRHGFVVSGSGACNIGRYCIFGPNCTIITQNHSYDDGETIPYGKKYTLKPVTVGDFVWCGRGVMLLPGTRIGEGAVIQAGSVVHGEIPPLAIAGGNPAKVFSHRNADHFYSCKQQGAFYLKKD